MTVLEKRLPHPLLAAVLVGLLLRLAAAAASFGWFASDDYRYVIEPAWRWLDDPVAPFPSPYRAELFARCFSRLLSAARAVGVSDPAASLQVAYAFLGAYSVLAIPGVYVLARQRLGTTAASAAAWLLACYALLPYLSTRPLIELAAVVPLVWGLALVTLARDGAARPVWLAAAGGLLLCLAALCRFQVGLVPVTVLVLLALDVVRGRGEERVAPWMALLGLLAGGALCLALLAVPSLTGGSSPLSTVLAYLRFNVEHSSDFGISPWYTYLLQVALYTVPPATLLIAPLLWRKARAHPLVAWPLIVFLAAHSLVPHKEDRFLFPVLPLLLVLLAAALIEMREGGRLQRAAYRFFWAVNLIALPFITLSDSQRNLTVPLLEIQKGGGAPLVATVGIGVVPHYYLGAKAQLVELHDLEELSGWARGARLPDYVLVRPAPSPVEQRLAPELLRCGEPRLFEGSLADRLLFALNREHHRRRAATALFDCRNATGEKPAGFTPR